MHMLLPTSTKICAQTCARIAIVRSRMATGDQHTRKLGADHGDSDDTPLADNVSDTLTATTMDDDIANGEWEDWDEDCEDTAFVCLFCPETFRSRGDTLKHCLSHGFDYTKIKKEWSMCFLS
jgi:hypothetical protein